ncbi:hypothetical protein DPMN_107180 [Dreissena polymorpha]|uniref:Uncharacterized protein n=1 Tax=Dreissena polymorpha TaxID=45954 RepID=A0A9D4QJW8_DREPO|nr:hypothetical protein DPMN_107180 [Dreissena polymorpha]
MQDRLGFLPVNRLPPDKNFYLEGVLYRKNNSKKNTKYENLPVTTKWLEIAVKHGPVQRVCIGP